MRIYIRDFVICFLCLFICDGESGRCGMELGKALVSLDMKRNCIFFFTISYLQATGNFVPLDVFVIIANSLLL